jgi:hypothetical protein
MPSKHFDTPTKAGLYGAFAYVEYAGLEYYRYNIFQFFGIHSETTAYRILKDA